MKKIDSNYVELIWEIAKTDFKLRYYGSILGYFWSLLKPLFLFLVLWMVFTVFMKWDIPNYQLYLLLGIMLWNFFAEGTSMGVNSLVSKSGILKKIYFPRIFIVIATTITAFLSLFFNLIVFFIFSFFSGIFISWHFILFIPVILFLYLIVLGVSLFLSALYIKLRDINQIWEVILQVGFWLTPIIYPLAFVPEKFQFYLFLNPITGIIQNSRLLLVEHVYPSFLSVAYMFGWAVLLVVIGFLVFKKLSPYAAEEL